MRLLRRWFAKLREPLLRGRLDGDLAQELEAHIAMLTDDNVRAGLQPDEAQRQARIALGGVECVKEKCRDAQRPPWIGDLWDDLRYAMRLLHHSPGFTLTIVAILALGIGANTAVFSVVNAVLLQPLPYAHANRIVALTNPPAAGDAPKELWVKNVSIPNFEDWRAQSSSFEAMAYYNAGEGPVISGGAAEYVRSAEVSDQFFRVFGVDPLVGRFSTPKKSKQAIQR